MARNWKDLRSELSPESDARVKERVERSLLEMNLAELRRSADGLTQAHVAELLGVTQSAISQLEKREDVSLGHLAEYVAALGGSLEVVAHFADKEVRITQFHNVRRKLAG